MYKNVWFQIIDKYGISFYRSWSDKTGDNIKEFRKWSSIKTNGNI